MHYRCMEWIHLVRSKERWRYGSKEGTVLRERTEDKQFMQRMWHAWSAKHTQIQAKYFADD
jgi:hypothetical protein